MSVARLLLGAMVGGALGFATMSGVFAARWEHRLSELTAAVASKPAPPPPVSCTAELRGDLEALKREIRALAAKAAPTPVAAVDASPPPGN